MDFVTGLLLPLRKKKVVWVIVDQLTKSAHFFFAVRTNCTTYLRQLYLIRILGSLRDSRNNSINLLVRDSTSAHLFTRRQMCNLNVWQCYLPLAEIVYNNSFQSSIQMALYEALYGCRCQTPICWSELCERKVVGPELIQEIEDIVKVIRDRLKTTFKKQKSYMDLKHRDIEFVVCDKVFLKISPPKKILRYKQKGKLSTRFIGLYEITERVKLVSYLLALRITLEKIYISNL
ncbi:pol protein [Gossypium australe]|uniref:Pol protein n=1 Tax=Gossypium australe TaxID=47621 RepID=A0A5B6UU43_9ROSI|nr:pol protein [Gossypium australe]